MIAMSRILAITIIRMLVDVTDSIHEYLPFARLHVKPDGHAPNELGLQTGIF